MTVLRTELDAAHIGLGIETVDGMGAVRGPDVHLHIVRPGRQHFGITVVKVHGPGALLVLLRNVNALCSQKKVEEKQSDTMTNAKEDDDGWKKSVTFNDMKMNNFRWKIQGKGLE